jgi:hypothetical protein
VSTTTTDALTKRLQAHAQGSESADNPKNLADYIWMLKHQTVDSGIDEIWSQLRDDFEDLNTLLNADSDSGIGRSLAYAINGLMTLCLDLAALQPRDGRLRHEMLLLAWRIGTAWDAVLAGDIERIGEHVELEETARGI